MSTVDLKKCPFCGGEAEIITQEGTSFCNVKVVCSVCSAQMFKLFNLSADQETIINAKNELAEKWNKRVR